MYSMYANMNILYTDVTELQLHSSLKESDFIKKHCPDRVDL